ncbi:MAG TPA: glycosyltransferase family 39 protein [Gaiellaceae bacterium]|jgi:4-amino-4-deoxy-L-arabinose transferase-like glycosyltransferase
MTAAVAAVRVRAERLRVAVSADVLALGSLAAFSLGLLGLVWGTWGDLDSDTGYDLVAGIRIVDGDLPYRDFDYFYGPLAPGISALAVLFGGSGLGSAVALGLLVAAAVVLATYALARTMLEPVGAALAAALTAAVALIPNNYSFVVPHTHAATLGTLALLGMLLCVWRYASSEQARWLLAAGASIGLIALTKPEPLVAAAFGAGLWLVLRGLSGARFRREAALLLAPALAIPAVVYGALAASVGMHRLVFENLYPVDFLDAAGNAMIKNRMPMTVSSFAEVGGKLALYAAGCAGLVFVASRIAKGGRLATMLIAACAFGGFVFVVGSLVKPDGLRDGMYYLYGWIPAGAVVALALLVRRYHRRAGAWAAVRQVELTTVAVLAVLALTTYASFVVHGWRPQMAVYYIPFAAVLLARLHLVELPRNRAGYVLGVLWIAFLVGAAAGLTLKDARAESATVRGPGGAIAETPAEARAYQSALDVIAARTKPGDPILVAPLMTGLYPLADRTSPLSEISLLPGALPTVADERAAIARLERAGVSLVITDNREWPGYGHTSFGGSFDQELARWVKGNFNHAATIRTSGEDRALDVWLKRRVP